MVSTQAPGLPSAADLAGLDPTVAIVLIVGGVLLAFLAYFGGPIRDRLTRKPVEPPKTVEQTGQLPAIPAAPAAGNTPGIDRAEKYAEQLIDNLLRQIEEGGAREDVLEHRIEVLEREKRDLLTDNQRLQSMLWQRGPR